MHIIGLLPLNWIEREQHIQDQKCTDDKDRQIAELILLLVTVIEQCVAYENRIDEYDDHVGDLDPPVVVVLHFVAHSIEHIVASLGEEPDNHHDSGALDHDFVRCLREIGNFLVVVGDPEV